MAIWFSTRNTIVVTWQAHSRRYVSNLHIRPLLARERWAAIQIQKIVRGKLARSYSYHKLRNMAATRIQVLWRGAVDRLRTDKLWLNSTVIPIQSMYRKRMALRRYESIRNELYTASLKVQRRFRIWSSRRKIGDKLHEREMGYRFNVIKMLTVEEELCHENVERSMQRMIKHDLKGKAEKVWKELKNLEEDIYGKENDLIEMMRQQEIVSPRARAQGFDVELAKNVHDIRNTLSDMKVKALFDVGLEMHRQDELFEGAVREMEEWAERRDNVAKWRDDVRCAFATAIPRSLPLTAIL